MTEEKAKEKSVTELLEDVHKKHDRLMRNRQAVAFLSSKIPLTEKLLKDGMKQLTHYVESTQRLSSELETMRKRLVFALEYCEKHDEDYEKLKLAEDLAKKLARLQKQITEQTTKLAETLNKTE